MTGELAPQAAGGAKGVLTRGLWAERAGDRAEEHAAAEGSEPAARGFTRAGAERSRLRTVASGAPFRGRYARSRPVRGEPSDVAWDATLRGAATRPRARTDRLAVGVDDLRVKVRMRRPKQLLLFVVDASGSMGGALTDYARRMAASALSDAYLKRASVAMVVFRARSAELVVGATRKVARLERSLDSLPAGGTTPLAAALALAQRTLQREIARTPGIRPTLILISDGRANVGVRAGHESVVAEVRSRAQALSELRPVRILFLDTTEAGKDDRAAQILARWLAAERLSLSKLTAAGHDAASVAAMASEPWLGR